MPRPLRPLPRPTHHARYSQRYSLVHTRRMADTTIKVDNETRDRFAALAAGSDMSLRAYLKDLSIREANQAKLGEATGSFRRAIDRPGFADAFDRDFGAPSTVHTHRAA